MARIHLTKRFEEKDIERWKKKAVKENRDLTNWMETVLNTAAPKLESVRKKQTGSNNAQRWCLLLYGKIN